MTDRYKTLGVLCLCVLGGGCDQAELRERPVEPMLAPAALVDAPSLSEATIQEAESLEPARSLEGELTRAPVCGPSSVSVPADLCPAWRVVGQFAGDCPNPYGEEPVPAGAHWTVEEVFAGVGGLPSGLGGYCRYVWTGTPGTQTGLPANISSVVRPDCRVFAQSPMGSSMFGAYEQAFHEGTRPLPSRPTGGHPVSLAIVDTAPARSGLDQAGHGAAMAAIASELAAGCVPALDKSSCRREVSTWLGLPQTATGPNFQSGGFFGYQSDLALGIMQAVAAWPAASDDRLVVNLSVGWEPVPDEFDAPTPAVQAVRDAIAVARCRGALVIAASGNRPAGTCFDQPTGPGGWERQAGPSAGQCTGLGVANHAVPNPLPSYYPFLYAATPLDWSNANLASYRQGSNARLAMTGFAGFDEHAGKRYGPISGSSVSTAALSGTAALVWSYFYGLRAEQVMDLIYQAGTATNAVADLHASPSGAPTQHQITACGVLQWACSGQQVGNWLQGGQHQAPSVCSSAALQSCTGTAPSVDVPAWESAFTIAFGQLGGGQYGNSNAPNWTTLDCQQCGADETVQLPEGMRTEPAALGWVLPQPLKGACPLCHIKGPDLYLSLDPDYDGYGLQTFSVYLYDAAGTSEVLHYRATDLVTLPSSTSVEVVFDSQLSSVGTTGLPPIRAEIAMTFTDPATGRLVTASNPLSID